MYVEVRYSESAFKHVSKEDIKHALLNAIYDDMLDEDREKHLLIGFDMNLNLLEILYNVLNDETIRVFHAMKCTEKYLKLINR
jgi:adenylate kinase family enzyme